MTDSEIDIREIKETLKKMQEDIKRLENSIPFYQYSPEIPTQACSYEEMVSKIEPKIDWLNKAKWNESTQKWE